MEEGEEQWDDDDIIAEYGAFNDTAMGETEEEVGAEDKPADDLGQAIRDAQREYESEKEKIKFEHMLEDHKKLLYPTCNAGHSKALLFCPASHLLALRRRAKRIKSSSSAC